MKLIKRLRQYPLFQADDFIRRVLKLAIPIVLQQMITALILLLEHLKVGQLGELALSAVAISNRYNMIGLFAINGVAVATGVYIAQFYGAGREDRVKESYRFGLLVSLAMALFIAVPGVLFPDRIGLFFVKDAAIVEPISDYLPIAVLAYIPQVYSLNTQNAMRTLGETRIPLLIGTITVISNAFLNFILIFGYLGLPALGVKGAAIGNFLARIIELLATRLAVAKRPFAFAGPLRFLFKVPGTVASAILEKAAPLVLNEIGFAAGMALLLKFYGTRGKDVIASMTIMTTTSELFFVLFSGLSVATTIVVGQPLGANDLEKARSNAYRLYKLGILLALVFSAMMFLCSYFIPHFYDVSDLVKEQASFFLKMYSVFYIVYTINGMSYHILRAGGDMRLTMILDSGFLWIINLPVVALCAYLTAWPIYLIFFFGQMTDFFKCFLSAHILAKETWVKNLAIEV